MKIVKFKGGIGNQLFQYTFAKYLEMECGEKVYLDLSAYGDEGEDINCRKPVILQMNMTLEVVTNKCLSNICIFHHMGNTASVRYKFFIMLEVLFNRKYILEKGKRQKKFHEIKNYTYFDGYWQSYKYAACLKDVIKKEFYPVLGLSEVTQKKIQNSLNEVLVLVGIRRGDYIKSKKNQKRYGILGEEYYRSAMKMLVNKVGNPVFYIFSNDIEWVKKNMNFAPYTIKYREEKEQVSDLEELFVMAGCRHAIISNSTFYWWGAWMIDNPDKMVIAPKNWFVNGTQRDIIPPDWIKL